MISSFLNKINEFIPDISLYNIHNLDIYLIKNYFILRSLLFFFSILIGKFFSLINIHFLTENQFEKITVDIGKEILTTFEYNLNYNRKDKELFEKLIETQFNHY
ncbi:hypothetical protein M0811_09231 [Anaeramoeba ignava]|uniref:Uncharacterized protein n=1 Tax=Anaeramoeba ignava TaxID=1746090 RepID=A0A9Q0RAE1_ANAIG|nr:hypothetical protein M0811_09231 [Anaeramoeba ignava]